MEVTEVFALVAEGAFVGAFLTIAPVSIGYMIDLLYKIMSKVS